MNDWSHYQNASTTLTIIHFSYHGLQSNKQRGSYKHRATQFAHRKDVDNNRVSFLNFPHPSSYFDPLFIGVPPPIQSSETLMKNQEPLGADRSSCRGLCHQYNPFLQAKVWFPKWGLQQLLNQLFLLLFNQKCSTSSPVLLPRIANLAYSFFLPL